MACNYNADATDDDGSCASLDDCGVCGGDNSSCSGCTSQPACNYDASATVSDPESCVYPSGPCDDCGGNPDDGTGYVTDGDVDGDGVCDVPGCTDELACNYDPAANYDDGSCAYAMDACDDMDETTINDMYDADCMCVGIDAVLGCTDEAACNYDAEAGANTDDGSCQYDDALGECGGDCTADENDNGICDVDEVPGCTDMAACNYSAEANVDDDSCYSTGDACDDGDANTENDAYDENCACVGTAIAVPGCTDMEACNYNPDATEDDGSCEYPAEYYDCDGNCLNDADGDGTCDELEIPGCTNVDACNYDEGATDDDGSCEVPGDACDDGDENTENDVYDENCVCAGTAITGVEESRLAFGMFPNPSTGEVTLQMTGAHANATIQITDGAGRVVWSQQGAVLQGNMVLDLSALSSGTYNVMVSDERGVSVRRLAIQK